MSRYSPGEKDYTGISGGLQAINSDVYPYQTIIGGPGVNVNTSNSITTITVSGLTTTTASSSPVSLNAQSNLIQVVVGANTQQILLPPNSPSGQQFQIKNIQSGNIVQVYSSAGGGGNLVAGLNPETSIILTCLVANTTVASGWTYL